MTLVRLRLRHPDAQFLGAPGDFLVEGVIENVVARVTAEAGRLDALVHCASMHVASTKLFVQTDPNDFAKVSSSLLCVFQQICHAARPHLAKQGGAIVGLVSDAGRFAAPHQSVMGAAFGGMITFARNVSTEISREGIRIHMISCSYVAETRVYERSLTGRAEAAAKRAGLGLPRPKDIAHLALFLCGPDSTKMTGQVISINGGLTV